MALYRLLEFGMDWWSTSIYCGSRAWCEGDHVRTSHRVFVRKRILKCGSNDSSSNKILADLGGSVRCRHYAALQYTREKNLNTLLVMLIAGSLDNLLSHVRLARVWLKHRDVRFERNVIIKGKIKDLILGNGVVIQSGTVLHLGGKKWCEFAGSIDIGKDSVISHNCVLYGAGPGGIRIGNHFDCGPNVGIFASRTDYRSMSNRHVFAPVTIGNDVIVYANVVIGPGVTIGNGAVIAAGSVVIHDVPENCLVGGTPAKILREGIR